METKDFEIEASTLKEGDRIKIIDAGSGAYGANGLEGIIVSSKLLQNSGLLDTDKGINVKIDS